MTTLPSVLPFVLAPDATSGQTLSESPSDVESTTDILARAVVESRALTEATAVTDAVAAAVTRAGSATATPTDTLAGASSLGAQVAHLRSVGDSVLGSDLMARVQSLTRQIIDTAPTDDTVMISLSSASGHLTRGAIESNQPVDILSTQLAAMRLAMEIVAGGDLTARTLATHRSTLPETVGGAGLVAVGLAPARSVTETLHEADVPTTAISRLRINPVDTMLGSGGTARRTDTADVELVHAMSNGSLVGFYDSAPGAGAYMVSTDDGTTWIPLGALAAPDTVGAARAITWQGDTGLIWTVSGGQIRCAAYTFNPAMNRLLAPTVSTWTYDATGPTPLGLAVDFDGLRWHLAILALPASGQASMYCLAVQVGVMTTPTVRVISWPVSRFDSIDNAALANGQIFISVADSGALKLLPIQYDAALNRYSGTLPYAFEAPTAIGGTAVLAHAMSVDSGGYVDLMLMASGNLYGQRRNSASAYAPLVPLTTGATPLVFTWARETSGDALHVIYVSTASQAAGELYEVRRASGSWKAAALLAGGPGGHVWPSASHTANLGLEVLYCDA